MPKIDLNNIPGAVISSIKPDLDNFAIQLNELYEEHAETIGEDNVLFIMGLFMENMINKEVD